MTFNVNTNPVAAEIGEQPNGEVRPLLPVTAAGHTPPLDLPPGDAANCAIPQSGGAGSHLAPMTAFDLDALQECSEDGRKIMRVVAGQRLKLSADCEEELAKTGLYYQRANAIVRVARDAATRDFSIHDVGAAELARALDGLTAFMRLDKRSNTWVPIDVTEEFCRHMLRAGAAGKLASLVGLVRQPYLRADGSICSEGGYDKESHLYGAFEPIGMEIPVSPTREEAEAALTRLDTLLDEFPFADEHDRSAALCAFLTAAVRSSLPTAPMIHVRAHAPGTGKSYLCDLISLFAAPREASSLSLPADDEEMGKVLLAELAKSPPVLIFDNLTTDLKPFPKLCSAISSETVSGRILGKSKTITVATRTVMLASGNNVGPTGDMTRRCITVNLDAKEELPATRNFLRPNLLEDVKRNRLRYVGDALLIIRAWMAAGEPTKPIPPLSNFEQWGNWCRQPLLWLDRPDPAKHVFTAMNEDPEREVLGALLAFWEMKWGADEVMVRDMMAFADSLKGGSEEFSELLHDIAGKGGRINRRILGWWIRKHAGQVARGRRLVKAAKRANAEVWRLQKM